MHVQEWLDSIPAVAIYVLVAGVIGVESIGVPVPGELVLVAATLLASQGDVNPYILGACASAGAVVGDSIGYAIGRRGGRPLLAWLDRKFPKHFGVAQVGMAERSFEKWGMWAVFFGRFIALLRIFAGPLAGVLRMPYWKFLTANLLGGVIWAGGTVAVVYSVGVVAEDWLKRFSLFGLVAAVLIGAASMLLVRSRAKKASHRAATAEPAPATAAEAAPATATGGAMAAAETDSAGSGSATVGD